MQLSFPTKMIVLALRVGLGMVFLWASWEKILKPGEFAAVIDNYRLLPQPMIGAVALLLPWIELFCGLALVSGVYVKGSLVIVNLMLIIFIAALGSNAIRGVDIDCGCFSVAGQARGRIVWDILRDIVFIVVGFFLLYMQYRYPPPHRRG